MKMYFFDKEAIVSWCGVKLTPAPSQKIGVVLESNEIIKDAIISNFCTPVLPLNTGGYRMYYSTYSPFDAKSLKIGIAHSDDGLKWKRENLGQILINGLDTPYIKIKGIPDNAGYIQPSVMILPGGKWRMYFWLHGPKIRYVAAESVDGINWRALNIDSPCLYHPCDKQIKNFPPGMGLTPDKNLPETKKSKRQREPLCLKRLLSNDATFTYFNARTNEFEMYSVWLLPNSPDSKRYIPYDNAPDILRIIHRRTSRNGLDWNDPELIIYPGENDPDDLQFYYLAISRHGEWKIGFLGRYLCKAQTIDIEISFSRDGKKWLRPLHQPWIKRGKAGEPDSKAIYPSSHLLDMGNYWLFYYTGCSHLHNASRNLSSSIMVAKFLKNRFVGLKTQGSSQGMVKTRAFIPSNAKIFVDADIKGKMRTELCDAFGETIPGYEMEKSISLKGDSTKHTLRWKNKDTAIFQYEAVSLKLAMNDGVIFSIYS